MLRRRARRRAVKPLDDRALELRHVALDREAELRLQVPQVAVASGKVPSRSGSSLIRADGSPGPCDPSRRSAGAARSPALAALLEEIVEAPGADHVDVLASTVARWLTVILVCAMARRPHVHARAAEEVQMLMPRSKPALLTSMNSPRVPATRWRYPAVVVPDGAEALPVTGVAPQRPVVHHFDDVELILRHQSTLAPESFTTFAHLTMSRAGTCRTAPASWHRHRALPCPSSFTCGAFTTC